MRTTRSVKGGPALMLSWSLCMPLSAPMPVWAEPVASPGLTAVAGMREIDWRELMPPDRILAVEEMIGDVDHFGGPASPMADESRAVAAMNGATGTLAGYVVPIATDSRRRIVELFLVPYYGACIHVPPPPANQIVHIKPDRPLPAGELWQAYRAIGTIRIATTANETATAIYAMDLQRLEAIESPEPGRDRWISDIVNVGLFLGFLLAVRAILRWHPATRKRSP